MNHIYKSIFNKALGVFTAVPEFASAHGKGSERTVVGRVAKGTAGFAASALAISVGLALTSTSAVAAPGIFINNGQDPACLAVIDDVATSALQLIYGGSKTIYPAVGVAAGSPLGTKTNFELDARNPCLSTGGTGAENHNTQTNRTLFYNNKNLTLGGRLDVNSGIIGVGDRGTDGVGATNSIRMGTGTTLADANKVVNGIAIGVNTQATQNLATAIGANAVASGNSASQALGYDAVASGKSAIAHGFHSHADGQSSIAIGDNAKASGIATVSLGFMANGHSEDGDKDNTPSSTKATYGTAVGHFAGADYVGTDNARSTALGNQAGRYGEGGAINTAVGNQAGQYVKGSQNVAMGHLAGSGDATNKLEASNTVSIGSFAKASANNAAAMGTTAQARTEKSLALGQNATAGDTAAPTVKKGEYSTAIGSDTTALGYGATAVGSITKAKVNYATALGHEAEASGSGETSLGYGAGANSTSPNGNRNGVNVGTNAGRYAISGGNNVAVGISAGQYVEGDNNIAQGYSAGYYIKGNENVSIGTNANVGSATDKLEVSKTVAIGSSAKALTNDSVAIGTEAKSGKVDKFSGERSVAIGAKAEALGTGGIAIGDNAATTNGHNGVAIGVYSKTQNEKAISIGAFNKATGVQSIVIAGNYDTKNSDGVSTATAARATVIGAETNVSGEQSVAIGDKNNIASARTYAIGNNINAAAGTDDSLAFGTRASVQGANTIAVGNTAQALTDDSITIGRDSKAGKVDKFDGKKSIAIGYASEAMGSNAIALGSNAATNNGHDSIAMGTYAKTNGEKTISIGAYNTAEGAQSIVIAGNYDASTGSNRSTTTAAARRAIVVGPESHATAEDAVAIGNKNTIASARTYAMGNNINVAANTDDSLVFGTRAHTDFSRSIAMGVNASTLGQTGVAIGDNAVTNGVNQISIGHKAGDVTETDNKKTRRPNVGNFGVMIGHYAGAEYTADEVTPVNHQHGTVAVGTQAGRAGKDSWSNIALGNQAGRAVHGNDNIAIGVNSGSGKMTDKVESDGKDVSTVDEYLNVKHSISVGTMSAGKNNYSIAIGTQATAGNGQKEADGSTKNGYSVAIGTSANASALNSVALGAAASASHEYSVALGRDSKTSDIHTGDYTLNNSYTAAGLPNAANGTVSVGSAGKARQIQNVAAGVISATSTDAINGSQLYATNNYMNNFAGDVKTKLGGNAALGNDGHLTMTNIGGTGENTVDDAIKNLKTAIDNKADTTASVTSENPADIKVDKEAPVGNTTNYKLSLGNDAKAKLAKAATALQTVEGDSNITATKDATDPTKVKLALNKDLTADSVTLGDTTTAEHVVLNKDGLTVGNLGPALSNSGIDMRGGQIGNLVGGPVKYGERTAVSAGMLYDVAKTVQQAIGGETELDSDDPNKSLPSGRLTLSNVGETGESTIHDAIKSVNDKAKTAVQEIESANPTALSVKKDGTKVTLTPNFITGDLVNADGTVNAPAAADEGKLVSAKTVADALKANHFVVDTKGNTETGSEADAKVGSGNKVTFEAGNNLVAKQANTANGGATVKFSLKDDISLNSVTAGTGDNQVVLGNDGVKVGGKTYINNDGLNANSKVISNVADGVNPNDAVNKSQLDAVKGVADSAVKSVDTVASEENLVVDNNDPQNPKLRLKKAVNLTSIKLDGATPGNTTYVSGYGLTIEDGPSVKKEGINAGDKKITNVAAGDVSATSKDAVNGGQLHNVATSVANVLGGNAAVDGNGNVTSSDIGGTGANTVDDAIKAVNATAAKHTTVVEGKNVKVTKGKNAAGGDEYTVATKDDLDVTSVTAGNTTVNTNGLTITGGPSVTRGGIDAGNAVITNVRDGKVEANSKDAVNGGQLHATNTKLDGVKAKADTAVQDVKSGDENALTAVKDPNTNIVTVTPKLSGDLVDANGNITAPTTPAEKGKLVTAGTVAQALANTHFVVDTKATDGELDAASQADQKIKAGNKVTLQAGKNLKAKQTNGANGAQVEFSLKDSISLTEVTAGTGDNQVVLGNNGVQVGGNTYINKDGLNANSKVISNVADGVNPNDAVNKGQLDAVKGVADSAVKSVDVVNGEQNLVVDNTDPKNPKLSLKKDLTVDSVKAGDSTLNTDGLTIAGGPSVKKDGIDAGDKKITNVAPGAVTPTSKDAVNGSQLYNVADNVKDLIGPDATIDPATGKVTVADPAQGIAGTGKGTIGEAIKSVKDKADTAVQDIKSGDEKALSVTKAGNTYTITPNLSGDLVDADGNITAPATDADKGKLVTAGTVAQALANTHFVVDTKATDGELDAASEADQKVKAGNKVTLQAGKNLKAKQTNGANGAQVEFSLKDSISLTQVTAGEGDNQVVLGNDGVKVGGNTYINKDGLNANNKPISNVADGVNPTDAVNKGQLDKVAGVADSAVKSVKAKDGEENLVVDNADPKNPKLSLKKDLTVDSVKAGDSTLNSDGLTIAGGPSVKKDGIDAGDKKITNVAPGAVTPTSKDAVNGSQLYNVANNVKDLIGPDAKIDPATGKVAVADPTKGIGETGKGTIGDAIKHVNDAAKAAADTAKKHSSVKAGNNIVVTEGTNAAGGKEYTVSTAKDLNVDSVKAGDTTVNNDGLTIAGGPSVKKGGIDAGDKKITNVAPGAVTPTSKDAVNGGQLYDVAKNVADLVGPDATIDPATGKVTVADPTKGIGETGKGTIGDAIKAVNNLAKKAAAEKTSVKAKDGRSNVTVTEGTNAAGGHEYTIDVERAVTEAGSDQVTVTSKHDADSNTTTYTVDVSDKTKASLAKADSAVQGLTSKDGNLNFNKGPNGNVEVSFNDNLNVKNITTDGVKAGDTTINSNGVEIVNGPSMTKDGINAGGKAITNVANGNLAKGSKDAVNGGQLHETAQSVADVIGGGATVKDGKVVAGQNGIGNTGQNTVHGAIAAINQNTANNFNQIRGDLRKMDRDLRGGIAGALATAGLPQAFRPGKSMVAAAASTYRGQSGLAIGVSRISDNGKVILKVTGNTNSRGDFGGTIGAGYQW